MTDESCRDAYYAYGVDIIRTAGLLLHTTPSVIYRASVLLQRFEASVDLHFRARYISAASMAAHRRSLERNLAHAQRLVLQSSTSPQSSPHMAETTQDADDTNAAASKGAEYFIPDHAQQEMSTGLVPLVDLRAPLDYCVHHLIDQEDIIYLCGACLFIATKIEDPAIRIRAVVNTCMRLSERRAGIVVNEQQKPPPARYEDFKACVVDAEETVLHQLGFQTFVESPYTYVLLYLNLLVEPAEGGAGEATPTSPSPAASTPAVSRVSSQLPPALVEWMVRAVQLVNDLPRCRQLLNTSSDVLALYAIQQTCPPDLALPASWTGVFGVSKAALARVARVHATYLHSGLGSRRAADALAEIRARCTAAPYRTVREGVEYERTLRQLRELHRAGLARTSSVASYGSAGNTTTTELASSFPPNTASIEELRDLIGASFASSPPPPPQPTTTATTHTAGSRRERNDGQSDINVAKWSRSEGHRGGTE